MGRLLTQYSNTVTDANLIEMSDSDLLGLVVPTICDYAITSATDWPYLRTTANSVYSLLSTEASIGAAYDYRSAAPGTHPTVDALITTTTFIQANNISVTAPSVMPVHYVVSGDIHQVKEMTLAEVGAAIGPVVAAAMSTGGVAGSYVLQPSTTSAPSGTWVVAGTANDTYYNSGGAVVTETYNLLCRQAVGTTGSVRPLRISGTNLVPMTDSEIQQLYKAVIYHTCTSGVGQFKLQTTTPSPGTWTNVGSYYDKRNDLTGVGYAGTYNSAFTQNYTGFYAQTFTGLFTGTYATPYTTVYNRGYVGGYVNSFVGTYTSPVTHTFTGLYTSAYNGVYTRAYTKAYSRNFTRTYTSVNTYAGTINVYNRVYTGAFNAAYNRPYTSPAYTGSRAETFNNTFTQVYAGTYTTVYQGTYTNTYTNTFTQIYAGSYVNTFTGNFTGNYARPYTGAFTGIYTGLTSQTSVSSTAYSLFLRTA